MKRLIETCGTLSLLLFFAVSTFSNDVWKGLEFEKTSVDDAIKSIGVPKKRRSEKVKEVLGQNGKVAGKPDVQVIEYQRIDGWEKVTLSFLNVRLFKVKFWPRNKTLLASDLTTSYKADFVSVEGFAKGVSLSVFDEQKEPSVPRVYPTVYYMVSAKTDRYIVAIINNGSFKAVLKQNWSEPTVQRIPGFV